MKEIIKLSPFKRFCMSIGNLPSSYVESLTYAELLYWFCDYLQNTVITSINNNAETVTELQGLFTELQNYVNSYFENLDVQEEINNKLDELANNGSLTLLIKNYVDPIQQVYENSINNTVATQNKRISSVENELSTIASGSPIPVSSTADMTDTTKAYLNTSNGKWYYYNGSAWVIGGTYQASQVADNSIDKKMLNEELKNAIFYTLSSELDKSLAVKTQYIKNANTQEDVFTTAPNSYSLVIPIDSSTKYIVKKIKSSRFALYTSILEPNIGVSITNFIQSNSETELEITSGVNDSYLTILFYNSAYDTLTIQQIYNSLKIYKGVVQETILQSTYLQNLIGDNIIADKYINLICEKNLGSLQKGYIAISSDDGGNFLADETIPLFLGYKTLYNKNIPLTMGLMSSSQIFSNGNTSRLSSVLSFINSTNSSVAIHGTNSYTSYSVEDLFAFLDEQKDYITNNLVAPSSIIFPNHDYNKKTSTIAGSYYGVCATGGSNNPITYGGESKLAGPRSNMYTLYRFSLFNNQMTNQKIKNAIDYAYEHNMIFMPFFHDITLHNDYNRCKALLDYCVEYANEKGLNFINIGDIPYIS